jgi:hypothetical protein
LWTTLITSLRFSSRRFRLKASETINLYTTRYTTQLVSTGMSAPRPVTMGPPPPTPQRPDWWKVVVLSFYFFSGPWREQSGEIATEMAAGSNKQCFLSGDLSCCGAGSKNELEIYSTCGGKAALGPKPQPAQTSVVGGIVSVGPWTISPCVKTPLPQLNKLFVYRRVHISHVL